MFTSEVTKTLGLYFAIVITTGGIVSGVLYKVVIEPERNQLSEKNVRIQELVQNLQSYETKISNANQAYDEKLREARQLIKEQYDSQYSQHIKVLESTYRSELENSKADSRKVIEQSRKEIVDMKAEMDRLKTKLSKREVFASINAQIEKLTEKKKDLTRQFRENTGEIRQLNSAFSKYKEACIEDPTVKYKLDRSNYELNAKQCGTKSEIQEELKLLWNINETLKRDIEYTEKQILELYRTANSSL
jgi:hypothetical protein